MITHVASLRALGVGQGYTQEDSLIVSRPFIKYGGFTYTSRASRIATFGKIPNETNWDTTGQETFQINEFTRGTPGVIGVVGPIHHPIEDNETEIERKVYDKTLVKSKSDPCISSKRNNNRKMNRRNFRNSRRM